MGTFALVFSSLECQRLLLKKAMTPRKLELNFEICSGFDYIQLKVSIYSFVRSLSFFLENSCFASSTPVSDAKLIKLI